jgi:oligosaccharyltransferase complex subunit beta
VIDNGYELTFRSPKDQSPLIIEYDESSFAHAILFASETKSEYHRLCKLFEGALISTHNNYFFPTGFASDITPQSLVSLLDLKTNLIIALSTKQNLLSSLASEFSLILPPPGTPLISYFPKRNEPASLIPISPSSQDKASKILSKDLSPVWFSGIPLSLGNNPLLVPILHAPAESFAAEVDGGSADAIVDAADRGGEGLWAGSQLSVVTGFQTLNGARVTWVGGVDVFSDELAQKEVSK